MVTESDVRTDLLSGTKVTTMDDVVGLVVFWDSRVTQAVVIVSLAFQSSSLSSVREWVGVVAWVSQCWLGLSGGRRVAVVGLFLTKLASGLDHSEMSLIQSGPDVSEMSWRALPMLLSLMFPLMAVEPKGRGKMFGNLMNLNFSKGLLLVGKKALSLGLSALEKSGPPGKDPNNVAAGTMANKFLIAEVLMQNNFDNDAKLDAVPRTMSLLEEWVSITGRSR